MGGYRPGQRADRVRADRIWARIAQASAQPTAQASAQASTYEQYKYIIRLRTGTQAQAPAKMKSIHLPFGEDEKYSLSIAN